MTFPNTDWQGYLQAAADQIYDVLGRFYMECAGYSFIIIAAILAAVTLTWIEQSRLGRRTRLTVHRSIRLTLRRLHLRQNLAIRH